MKLKSIVSDAEAVRVDTGFGNLELVTVALFSECPECKKAYSVYIYFDMFDFIRPQFNMCIHADKEKLKDIKEKEKFTKAIAETVGVVHLGLTYQEHIEQIGKSSKKDIIDPMTNLGNMTSDIGFMLLNEAMPGVVYGGDLGQYPYPF